jgi:hypothetical protein
MTSIAWSWSYDNLDSTYPVMQLPPKKVKQMQKQIVNGEEREVEVEVEVVAQRKRLFLFAPSIQVSTGIPDNSTKPTPLRLSRVTLPPDLERSYGELDTYPLRHSSALCKATGGGLWQPKPIPVLHGYRRPIPGGKAPFEIHMECEEMLDRQQRENPVIKDGEFQYRFAKAPKPLSMARSPHNISTF